MLRNITLILAFFLLGTGVAAVLHHNRYGYRTTYFGPFDADGNVTIASLDENPDQLDEVYRANPRLTILGSDTYNFGTMRPGSTGSVTFEIQNVGSADLALELGETTCKCTASRIDNELIKPRRKAEIVVSWTAKSDETNDFVQTVEVLSNDPDHPRVSLTIRGKIISDLQLSPRTWSLGSVAQGDSLNLTGRVFNFTDTPIQTGEVVFEDPDFEKVAKVDVREMSVDEVKGYFAEATQGFTVDVAVESELPEGMVNETLAFHFVRDSVEKAKGSDEVDPDGPESDASTDDANSNDGPDGSETATFVASPLRIPIRGRIVSPLRMIESDVLQPLKAGGYRYDFGKVQPDDENLSRKMFLILKGGEKDNTQLTLGDVGPSENLSADLGEAKTRGSMTLYPLTLTLSNLKESVSRRGNSEDDFGIVRINSDNPKVPSMDLKVLFDVKE